MRKKKMERMESLKKKNRGMREREAHGHLRD